MATGSEILRVATREIGYHEYSNHYNKYGEWFGLNEVPWCMEFVQWVYHQVNADLPYKTASCGDLLNWYRDNQPECVSETPIAGCIVIFDFPNTGKRTDHTGIFVQLYGEKITTIDGNTGSNSDASGGWVQQKTRKLSYANPVYIVPRGLEEVVDIDKLIAQMTDEQAYKLYCKAERHMASLPLPVNWDASEYYRAVENGLTDGLRPMCPARRYQDALMSERAMEKAVALTVKKETEVF